MTPTMPFTPDMIGQVVTVRTKDHNYDSTFVVGKLDSYAYTDNTSMVVFKLHSENSFTKVDTNLELLSVEVFGRD
jgi:hypothetical protein